MRGAPLVRRPARWESYPGRRLSKEAVPLPSSRVTAMAPVLWRVSSSRPVGDCACLQSHLSRGTGVRLLSDCQRSMQDAVTASWLWTQCDETQVRQSGHDTHRLVGGRGDSSRGRAGGLPSRWGQKR